MDLTIATPEIPAKNQWDYTNQLETRLQTAYESVNQHLKASTQRMKTRYDARVKPLTFVAGDFAYYYNPRRSRGRYHKWARLCILCRVERKINEVLYLIRVKPRGRTSVVHVDRLKVFQGEVPAHWKDSVAQGGDNQAGPHDREADREANSEAVQSTVRPHLTAEMDSNQCQGSSSHHPAETGRPNDKFRLRHPNRQSRELVTPAAHLGSASDKPAGHTAESGGRCQQPNSTCAAPQPAPYRLRSPAQRSLPARFRYIQTASFEANEHITMESSKAKRSSRTEAQKKLRHERNKGPWTCGLCEHQPFGSIAGFRNHTIIEHKQNCSWTGKVTASKDEDHLAALTSSVRNSQLNRSAKRRRKEDQQKEASPPSTPSKSQQSSSLELSSPAVRCCRIRLSPLSASASTSSSLTIDAEQRQVPDNGTNRNQILAEDTARVTRVGRHSIECQTPLAGSLYLPEDLSLEQLLDIVHANPGLRVGSLMRLICRSRPVGLPDQQYVVVEPVLNGMVMAANRIANVVAEQVRLLSVLDPLSADSIRQRMSASDHINGLIHQPTMHSPQPLPPLDLTNVPADVDVIGARGRQMIYLSEMVGRRPPSPVVEGEINGAAPEYFEISDDEYAMADDDSSSD